MHPRGQLADLKVAERGVVIDKNLPADGRGVGIGVSFDDAGRH